MSKLWCNLCSKCYAMDCFGTYFTHFTYVPQPGVGWGGGVGCNDMHCTCKHIRCYAIVLAHMFDAMQLHLRTCWMLRNCTCAHVRCYAIAFGHISMRNAVALGHMFDATQLHLGTCANFSKRGSSNGHGVLNSYVWTRICPSSSSSNT